MATTVYLLCTFTAFACAWLLFRSYHQSGYRLLFWSALSFVGLFFNNLLLIFDRIILPDYDLSSWRLLIALVSLLPLLYGLIWEEE